MQIINTPHDLQSVIRPQLSAGRTLGFVPTMGALHEGHLSLVKASLSQNDLTVVSIFVNPTQFGPNEDFGKYPRTLSSDADMLAQAGVHYIYAPSVRDMYPEGNPSEISIHARDMDKVLCGASRPGHFSGVMQVVAKLLHHVSPTRAYFGRKDWQQFSILSRMVSELFFPVEMIGCPIVREADGLAMSSRNRYLNPAERQQALFLSHALREIAAAATEGSSPSEALSVVQTLLPQYPLIRLDYAEILQEQNLRPLTLLSQDLRPRAFIAAWCGTTRLIDNRSIFGAES